MIKYNAISMIGKIRDSANKLIQLELENHGVQGLSPSHGDILICLYKADGLSIKELAEKIHRTQPTVTVLVDKLQKFEYVERVKSVKDSRVTLIRLSGKGKELEPVFHQISAKLNKVMYGDLDKDEKEMLESFLERILNQM